MVAREKAVIEQTKAADDATWEERKEAVVAC